MITGALAARASRGLTHPGLSVEGFGSTLARYLSTSSLLNAFPSSPPPSSSSTTSWASAWRSERSLWTTPEQQVRLLNPLPPKIRIVEVGARDGLQNEKSKFVPTATKIELIQRLIAAGLKHIEATAFVRPDVIPELKDHDELMRALKVLNIPGAHFSVLAPNTHFYEQAVAAGADEVAVFTAASESFVKANIHMDLETSLDRFRRITAMAKKDGIPVRGYVSCVLGCPYEGRVDKAKVVYVAQALLEMGCYEISLGDTIGVGTPGTTQALLDRVLKVIPASKVAVHFHDTYGTALCNILVALTNGIAVVDSSVSGLGGCPYAPGAAGNVATEDVVFMLKGLGVESDVNLDALVDTSDFISTFLRKRPQSKVANAILARREYRRRVLESK